jgi:hypothetical protein
LTALLLGTVVVAQHGQAGELLHVVKALEHAAIESVSEHRAALHELIADSAYDLLPSEMPNEGALQEDKRAREQHKAKAELKRQAPADQLRDVADKLPTTEERPVHKWLPLNTWCVATIMTNALSLPRTTVTSEFDRGKDVCLRTVWHHLPLWNIVAPQNRGCLRLELNAQAPLHPPRGDARLWPTLYPVP